MKYFYVWSDSSSPPWRIFHGSMDGVLVSKGYVADKIEDEVKEVGGILEFLGWDGSIMGDCGAYSYVDEYVPPLSPEELLKFYDELNFDVAAHLDHLILKSIPSDEGRVNLSRDEMKRRQEITIRNAAETRDLLETNRFDGLEEVIGVCQGWSPESYVSCAEELLEMGYSYLGLGGISRTPNSKLKKILREINRMIDKDFRDREVRLHLFGVCRPGLIRYFQRNR